MNNMHRLLLSLGLAAIFSPTITAQAVEATLSGDVFLSAHNDRGHNSAIIPAGPIITQRSATAWVSGGLFFPTTITMAVSPTISGARWTSSASVGAGVATGSCVAPNCAKLIVRAPGQSVGSVVVTASVTPGGRGSFAVDVGGDGTREIEGSTSLRREFRVCGTRDLEAHLFVLGSTQGGLGPENIDISLQIVPGLAPVATTAYGTDCGAQLSVVDRPVGALHNLTFSSLLGFPDSIALLLVGVGRAQVPIQGCDLLTAPFVVFHQVADGQGRADFLIPVHGVITGLVFNAQAASFDANLQLRTSRGAEVTFRDC